MTLRMAVAVKVDRLKISRKRRSRHSVDRHEICLVCWNAAQRRECEERKRKLDAQRDGRRKEVSQTPPKNGKMAGVKTTGKR